jgi:hypothetical protein
VQDAADHDHVVERLGRKQCMGGLQHHTATCRHRLGAARHDRPLHVQRSAAVALIGGESQMIDEHGERREREMMCEDDADVQRWTRAALHRRNSLRYA